MSIFKCKMCGGNLEITEDMSVCECEYCGTKQTVPRLDSDRKANLYDRANHFRRNNDYDKAIGIYEQILNEDSTDAEAYWSLVLCRYGIEYVEDPQTHKRIPTVNRAQYTSIYMDEDYKSALQHADTYQKSIYEEEAKAIDDIQKGILEISSKEEPFDVFICYKETDANGRRTQDSVLANDLYHQLTQEGFKVFFSRITLEDKLGTAYEPYIFAALNSAKVMVVIGTRPEYFNAVWVKNEWSRYLALVKNSSGKKTLIPAYRDMDPYDLPEEFSHLQAQDMSKLGFMQDLIRGIKKISKTDEPQQVVKETVVVSASVAPLIERAFLFLEDGKWQDADIYCEKILDVDPKNAEAYLGKLMAELQVRNRKQLADCDKPFDDTENYGKVIRFGDEKLESEMRGYLSLINERVQRKDEDEKRKRQAVLRALKEFHNPNTRPTFEQSLTETNKKIRFLERVLNDFDPIQTQISSLRNELHEISSQETQLTEQRKQLGLFAGKEKKRIDDELATVVDKKSDITTQIEKKKNNIGNYDTVEAVERDLDEARKTVEELERKIESSHINSNNELSFEEAMDIYLNDSAVAEYVDKFFPAARFSSAIHEKTNTILFGRYAQKIEGQPEPIEWKVLARENGRMLVVSKYALDCQRYHFVSDSSVLWETCSLRKWLNERFLISAFTSDERALILDTPIKGAKSSNDYKDKLFLLGYSDICKYMDSKSARLCQGTSVCYGNGAFKSSKGYASWWYSHDNNARGAARVDFDGALINVGGLTGVFVDNVAVRPAMWIDISSSVVSK